MKKLLRMLLGDYCAYYIYTFSTEDAARISASPACKIPKDFEIVPLTAELNQYSTDPLLLDQADYMGEESLAFGCFVDKKLVGFCAYWYAERYRKRNFWPLQTGQAKLVQIITVPAARGRGAATALIVASCQDMMRQGFERVFARIWHSNTPSLQAFERAGWSRIALVIEINPLRRRKAFRLQFAARGTSAG